MPGDDFFIRRFARDRDAGRADAARQTWEDACVRKWDLVNGLVRGHTFPGGGHLSPEDQHDAANEAMLRILKMGERFRGSTAPEFRAAIKRAVWYTCMDVGREALAWEQHSAGSLDDLYEGSDVGRFESAIAALSRNRGEQAIEAEERELEDLQAMALVRWGISQIANENYRVVLEMTFIQRLDGDEIAARLGITTDNVYQRRSRGLKKLEEMLRDHRP
jgi:RNA polymerase sigma factor (sigma-70 family)